jgi:salicylate hydroxylase
MTEKPILVAGGGIAGLAAGLGLSRIGRQAMIFEQAPAFEEVGAGLQMSPNGVAALRWLGAWEAVEPACVIPTEIHVRDGRSGGLLQRVRLGKPFEDRFGAPYRVCHRADLLAGLVATANKVTGIDLFTNSPVAAVAGGNEEASLALAAGAQFEGDIVIGADGIGSKVRQTICGTVAPQFRGHAIFRTLLPFGRLPPTIEADCVTLWLCPGGHVVHYPVSNWRNFNIVAAINSPPRPAGWGTDTDGRDLREALAGMDEALESLLAAPLSWLAWPGADLPDLPHWTAGRVGLTGDAAHATLPYLAQGAVMALEDATVLAACIAGGSDPVRSLQEFERLRHARTLRIQDEARRLAGIYHARGFKAFARNRAMGLMRAEGIVERYAWIYDWRPPALSGT